MTPLLQHLRAFINNRIPAQLVIQLTNHCNAHCPQCGMRVTADIQRSTLDDDSIKRMLDAAGRQGVQAVSFTGGEPLIYLDRLLALIQHAGGVGIPLIRTGTNGFLFRNSHKPDFIDRMHKLADRLAATPLRNLWISLDSAHPKVHEQMRGLKDVVSGIEKALPILHAAGIYPSANLGINRNIGGDMTRLLRPDPDTTAEDYHQRFYHAFQQAFDQFYHLARHLGFTMVNTCYPMSISDDEADQGLSAVYAATAAEDIVRFTASEKLALYQALMDTIPSHRHRLRIFTPLSALHMLIRQYRKDDRGPEPFGCRGGTDFFFVNATDGNTYPCGYRGNENLGPFEKLILQEMRPNGDCRRCDWECFRDPSELCAPMLNARMQPLDLLRHIHRDRIHFQNWLEDIRYYRACELFDGRQPINLPRLSRFNSSSNSKLSRH
jgi:MoaA/NifB/PqqE/SkfB family radical SAM enzyme